MGKKRILAGVALLTFVHTAAAQVGGIGGGQTGIIPLLAQLIGVEIGNPLQVVGIAATLGLMTVLLYLPIKLGAKRLEVGDAVLGGGRNGGRNIALIIAVLMTLSTLPTGFFALLVNSYSILSVFAGLGVLVVATYAVFSFVGTGYSGLGSLSSAVGRGIEADAHKAQADNLEAEARAREAENDAMERMHEARERAREIEDEIEAAEAEAEDGGEQGSEEEEEDAVRKIRDALDRMGSVAQFGVDEMEKDEERIEEAIKDAKEALSLIDDEEDGILDISKRYERCLFYMRGSSNIMENQVSNGDPLHWDGFITGAAVSGFDSYRQIFDGWSAEWQDADTIDDTDGGYAPYGLFEARNDLRRVEKELDMIFKEIEDDEQADVAEAFADLLVTTVEVKNLAEVSRELKQELQEVHATDEEIEEIAESYSWRDLYQAADQDEEMEQQVRNRIDKLDDFERDILPKIKEAYQLLEKHTQGEESEIEALDNLREEAGMTGDNALGTEIDEIINIAQNNPDGNLNVAAGGSEINYDLTTGGGVATTIPLIDDGSGVLEEMLSESEDIKDKIMTLADSDRTEDQQERELLDEVKDHLQDVGELSS